MSVEPIPVRDPLTGETAIIGGASIPDQAARIAAWYAARAQVRGRKVTLAVVTAQARTAFNNNREYLDRVSPTNAQIAAQVRSLTQQNNGIIRILASLIKELADLLDDDTVAVRVSVVAGNATSSGVATAGP